MAEPKVYRGHAESTAGAHVVEVWVGGQLDGVLRHHAKHSPSGFSWGYAGSGPADLARCLLIDHLGDAAVCPTCKGEGRTIWRDDPSTELGAVEVPAGGEDSDPSNSPCSRCWGERFAVAPALYQAFKFDFVAGWPTDGDWMLASDEITDWLARQPAT